MTELKNSKVDLLSELAVKESILGLMKSRDVINKGYIHTSDFRGVITEYGFEMGNKLIQSILVKCNIDTQGNIKYSPLEKALNDERNILLSQKDSQYQLPSSQGFSQVPVRADQAHKDKIRSEANLTNLQSNRADIQQMYTKYVNGTCSEEEFKSLIEGFGISLTQSFHHLLRKSRSCLNVPFSDFYRSLSTVESGVDGSELVGGGRSNADGRQEENGGIQDLHRRRRIPMRDSNMGHLLSDTHEKVYRKTRGANRYEVTSNDMRDALAAAHSEKPYVAFTSFNQEVHSAGSSDVGFTSELKIAREKVLAALRKVDHGEITTVEMQNILFEMGIEPPDLFLTNLQRKDRTGHLDWRKCVRLLDEHVFKPKAYDSVSENEMSLGPLKEKFLKSIKSLGPTSISKLSSKLNQSNMSVADLKKAYFVELGLHDLTDDEIRKLLISFDKNGDGLISPEEFLSSIRGPLNQRRMRLADFAFKSLDKGGIQKITVENFIQSYDASYHPEVQDGFSSEGTILGSIMQGMNKVNGDYITRDEFLSFIGNLSMFIDDDDAFENMMKGSWKLTDKEPAPPSYESKYGFDKVVFSGRQHHGDILGWQQEPSKLESMSPSKARGLKALQKDFQTSNEVKDEYDRRDIAHKNHSSVDYHLTWEEPRKSKAKDKVSGQVTHNSSSSTAAPYKGFHPDPNFSVTPDIDETKSSPTKWSGGHSRMYGTHSCPYGKDPTTPSRLDKTSPSSKGKPNKVKSLAEIMGKN